MARTINKSVDKSLSIKQLYAIAAIGMLVAIAVNYVIMSTLISDHKRLNKLNQLSSELQLSLFHVGLDTRNILVELDKSNLNTVLVERMQNNLHDRIIHLENLEKEFIEEATRTKSFMGNDIHAEVDQYYFNPPYNLREKLTAFLERGKILSKVPPVNLKRLYRRWSAIDLAMASEGLFVQGVTAFTQKVNEVFNNSAVVLKRYFAIFNGLILIVLVLEIVLIFQPLHQRLRRSQAEQEKVHNALKHRIRHDGLTGLANRVFFKEQLKLFSRGERNSDSFAVVIIDLNDFKAVNDTYGHQAGDALLAHVGEQIRSCLRDCDYGFRLGGDEFALILDGVVDEEQEQDIAFRVLTKITETMDYEGNILSASASAGFALFPHETADLHELIQMADQRMYQEKGKKLQTAA